MDDARTRGVLLGLACGDSLGRPVEFESAAAIERRHGTLREMEGHGTWNQPAGTVTDDTEQALCIARSVVERGGWDPSDTAERFVAWYDTKPFDIGNMTARSLRELKRGAKWDEAGQRVWKNSQEGSNAGNGSVMRCPPLAVAFAEDPDTLSRASRQSSAITHADPRCTVGCDLLNRTVAGLLRGDDDPLAAALAAVDDVPEELRAALEPVAAGEAPTELRTTGYVVHTLQTALWDGLHAESAEEAIVRAVNRGGDTDTVGAVAGAVAGVRFGASALPERWLATLDGRDELERLGTELADIE